MNNMNYKKFKHLPHHSAKSDSAKTTTTENGRMYEIDGKTYPSVTTVTGFAKQAFFAEWRKNNPKEMTRVLDRGNKLHHCYRLVIGRHRCPNQVQQFVICFLIDNRTDQYRNTQTDLTFIASLHRYCDS